jgi:hypothetical protein
MSLPWLARLTPIPSDYVAQLKEQLLFATSQHRCLFTFNRGDFFELHGRMIGEGSGVS